MTPFAQREADIIASQLPLAVKLERIAQNIIENVQDHPRAGLPRIGQAVILFGFALDLLALAGQSLGASRFDVQAVVYNFFAQEFSNGCQEGPQAARDPA